MTNNIDDILLMRRAVDVPPGLAQRIINMSQPHKQTADSWAAIWADIQAMFVIPRPAYALALAVFLGLFIGWDNTTAENAASSLDMASFLSVDATDIDNGDWL